MSDAPDPCSAIVRAADPDRYLADLFAPAAARPHLLALHAFAAEIADVRRKVSDPTLGEIRLKWWEAAIRGEHGGSPVAAAVAGAIARFDLPVAAFDRMLAARAFDLYDDPMPSMNDLEGYAGDTESTLMQLGAMVLAGGRDPGTAEVAGFAGVAVAITRVLRTLPAGGAFLPADILDGNGGMPAGVAAAAAALRARALARLGEARSAWGGRSEMLLPAFLPAAMVPAYLGRMERPGFDPLRDTADVSPFRRQWTLWRAARAGRF